jgi:hypothetical protein
MVSSPSAQLRITATDGPLITLYYDTNDEVYDPTKLTIVKNTTGSPSSWTDIGGAGTGTPTGSITSTLTAFNSFSRFTIANDTGGNNPLPVMLLSFDHFIEKNNVILKWQVEEEENVSHYEIQKSGNGIDWVTIETIKNIGFSEYRVSDNSPIAGNNYYRLLQYDVDEKMAVYGPLKVNIGVNVTIQPDWQYYPSPASDALTISAIHQPKEVSFSVYTTNGNIVNTIGKLGALGQGLYQLDVSAFAAGLYIVKAVDSLGNSTAFKFIKK